MPAPLPQPVSYHCTMKSARMKVRRMIGGRIYERSVSKSRSVSKAGWLTTDELVRLVGISRRHVFNLIALGKLHPGKVGRGLRFRVREALDVKGEREGRRRGRG